MYIILAGLNHKTAPVDIREKCAFSKTKLEEIHQELKRSDIIDGAVLLVTCNRTEMYATAQDVRHGLAVLEKILQSHSGMEKGGFAQYTYQHFSYHAIAHLFSVTSGLDSMILGEQQILGQIKDAYQVAVDTEASNGVLNILFQTALHVGKKVRTATGINRYPVSVSSAAVELCREIFETLGNKEVLVLGAGETGELAVKHLMSSGVQSVIVSNRSYDRAVQMASAVNGRAVHFDNIAHELLHADIVISCTAAPHHLIRKDNCGEALLNRNSRELVMIDIAVPRDIEPELGEISGVFLYDIDDLQNVVETNYKERLKAAHKARDIIEQETLRFSERLATLSFVPVIRSLKQYAESVEQDELKKAMKKLRGISERGERIVNSLAHGIVKKLLHSPFAKLKEKAVDDQGYLYADVVKDLFGLDIDDREYQKDAQNKTGNEGQ
jgi:glutamyl-tRNA reductase